MVSCVQSSRADEHVAAEEPRVPEHIKADEQDQADPRFVRQTSIKEEVIETDDEKIVRRYLMIDGKKVLHGGQWEISYRDKATDDVHGIYYAEYAFGKLHGVESLSDGDGTLHWLNTYSNGKQHGLSLQWGGHGDLNEASVYMNGKLETVAYEFSGNRVVMEQTEYKDGLEDGLYVHWDNGPPWWPTIHNWYKAGKLHGWSTGRDVDTGEITEELYKNDEEQE